MAATGLYARLRAEDSTSQEQPQRRDGICQKLFHLFSCCFSPQEAVSIPFVPNKIEKHLEWNLSVKRDILTQIFQYLDPCVVAQVNKEWNTFAYTLKLQRLEENEDFRLCLQIFRQLTPRQTPKDDHTQLLQYVSNVKGKKLNHFALQRACFGEAQWSVSCDLFEKVAIQLPKAKTYLEEIGAFDKKERARLIQQWYLANPEQVKKIEKLCLVVQHKHVDGTVHNETPSLFLTKEQFLPLEFYLFSRINHICLEEQRIFLQMTKHLSTSKEVSLFRKAATLDPYSFQGVKRLNLRGKQIDNLSSKKMLSGIGVLKNIKALFIESLIINACFKEICSLTQLESLGLLNCKKVIIPNEIEKLTCLKHLRIWNTPIPSVPNQISTLPKLEALHVQIEGDKFPEVIFKITQLKYLAIAKKGFDVVPKELTNLVNLEVLLLVRPEINIVLPNALTRGAEIERNESYIRIKWKEEI